MKTILRNTTVFTRKGFEKMDIATFGDRLLVLFGVSDIVQSDDIIFDFDNKYILPGFVDVHVHFREPGFSYKEMIDTGSMTAAHAGLTTVFTMLNLNPPTCNYASLKQQLDLIEKLSLHS
ncbi:MAG: amidohydrolase family protein [Erysipelotrichaceae bacterium]|nr:amidohydrolase family protein [Erysipelotrichaceae bacterium]MDY6034088.1 amidohydrolase family protein [Bulleidia sp.]